MWKAPPASFKQWQRTVTYEEEWRLAKTKDKQPWHSIPEQGHVVEHTTKRHPTEFQPTFGTSNDRDGNQDELG